MSLHDRSARARNLIESAEKSRRTKLRSDVDIPAKAIARTMKSVKRKGKSFVKKTYIAISLFVIGALHLVIVRQATNPSIELKLALVRNEFLDKPPTKIVVFGELHSGDDYAADVLRSAFGGDVIHLHDHVFRHELFDKHELTDIADRTDVLWVMVVRSPCDWADAVIRYQREACRKNELESHRCKDHEFASDTDYYRIPWYDVHGKSAAGGGANNIIESTRHNFEYGDIFDLRRQKLLLMKQITDVVSRHVKILRLREFELNPDVFVQDLVKEYKFKLDKKYKPFPPAIDPQSTFFNPENIYTCMDYSKWIESQQRIDWILEGYFGYNHLDCHLCRDSWHPAATSNGLPISSPSSIYVLGERNSGTTFVSNTLGKAFDPPNTMGGELEKFSSDIPVLLFKHMFRHDLLDEEELAEIKARDDILWIMVVRSPCDWAEGMYRKPYHLCPAKNPEKCGPDSDPNDKVWLNQNSVAGLSLLEFFTEMEWKDWAESVPFLREKTNKSVKDGGEEISISKVSANYTYPNVFALRRHKLQIMKQIIEAVPRNVKFVRLKELERSPEVFVQSVVREFNVTVKDGYESQPPSKVAHPTVCLTPDEWDAAQSGIDWKIEAEFGFSPCDCRMCYGYDKSTRLYTRVQEMKKTQKILGQGRRSKSSKLKKTPDKKKRGKKEKEEANRDKELVEDEGKEVDTPEEEGKEKVKPSQQTDLPEEGNGKTKPSKQKEKNKAKSRKKSQP